MLGFQDLSGLKATFGKDEAEEILAICDNKAILHLGSPESARWASDLFAETLRMVESNTVSDDRRLSRTTKEELVREALPIQFFKLRLAENTAGAIEGFFHCPGQMYRRKMSATVVDAAMPPRLASLSDAFIERNRQDQSRVPWTDADFDRFAIRNPRRSVAVPKIRRELQTFDWSQPHAG